MFKRIAFLLLFISVVYNLECYIMYDINLLRGDVPMSLLQI